MAKYIDADLTRDQLKGFISHIIIGESEFLRGYIKALEAVCEILEEHSFEIEEEV